MNEDDREQNEGTLILGVMPKKERVFSEQTVAQEICAYLNQAGVTATPGILGGIRFDTGVDTWLLFVTQVSASNRTASFVLLHKDNIQWAGHRKHKLYRGIPDFHVQKKYHNADYLFIAADYAMSHKRKWQAKSQPTV